jgi:crotonobetainyl-CoA:carnitine CoA-transferase CaiB-like acyl-CoA transferase
MMEGLYSDVVSALTTVIAAVAGLVGMLRGAMGPCSSDVSQWEATLALCAETVMAWSIRKEDRASMGYASPTLVPQGAYAALPGAGEQEWVCVSVGSDREWQALTRLMNSSSQVAAGWSDWDLAERIRHADEIDSALAQWLGSMPGDAAVASLRSAGLAAAMVCSIEDIFVDPQLGHRSTFVDVEHPLAGIEPMPGIPWKLMRTPGVIRRPAPLLGEHTRHVLRTHLDIDDATFARLVASGAIEVGPPELITAARPTAKGRDS